jgi:hypothetical protein
MSQLTNPNYLYLHSSIASQSQVEEYIKQCLNQFEKVLGVKLNKEFIVNTVTKFDGMPLKHSFVWFKKVQTAELFLNKDLDGKERVEEFPDPDHDTSQDEKRLQEFLMRPTAPGERWEHLVEEEEILTRRTQKCMIKRPMKPLIEFTTIPATPEQLAKWSDQSQIEISFYPCKIQPRPGYSHSKLFAVHVSKDISESQIRKYFDPFSSVKKDKDSKKEYPLVHIDRKSSPNSVTVMYQPFSMDAVFAINMIRKLYVNEKCTLNFDLYREN